MAEFVDFRIGNVQPILEELLRTNIFNENTIRSITTKLTHFEYKLQRKNRKLDTVLEYISYESTLLHNIIKRRKELNYFHKKQEIDDALIHRISCQFGTAKRSFSHDIAFWKAIIEFNLKLKYWEKVSTLYKELLDLHGTKHPHLYSTASEFEFNRKRSRGMQAARQVYLQGLRIHPGNLTIAINGFVLELNYVKYLHDNPAAKDKILTSTGGEGIMDLKYSKAIYEHFTQNQCDADVFLRFYYAAKPYDFAKDMLKEIIRDVQDKCKGCEKTYEYLAKMQLKNGDVEAAIQHYTQGMRNVRTKKMFDYFAKTLEQTIAKTSSKYLNLTLSVFEVAHQQNMLSISGYVLWIQVVHYLEKSVDAEAALAVKDKKSIKEIIKLGQAQGGKEDTWPLDIECIHLAIKENFNAAEILKYIKEIRSVHVSKEFYERILLQFLLHKCSGKDIYKLLELIKNIEAKASLRVYYLLHLGHNDIISARHFYGKVYQLPPYNLKLHETMIQLEEAYLDASRSGLREIRRCYEIAVLQFGSSDPDLWGKFCDFEKNIARDVLKASYLHTRAEVTLQNDALKQTYIARYLLK